MQGTGGGAAGGGSLKRQLSDGAIQSGRPAKKRRPDRVVAGPDPEPPRIRNNVTAEQPVAPEVQLANNSTTAPEIPMNNGTMQQSAAEQDDPIPGANTVPTSGADEPAQPTQPQAGTVQTGSRTAAPGSRQDLPSDPNNTLKLRLNPAPIPESVPRLKMVHLSDLVSNTTPSGEVIPRVPLYKAAFEALFDHNSGDIMFQRGGPVISIFIPRSGQRGDADYHVMLCDVRCCTLCMASTTATLTSGITQVDTSDRYKGLPLIHRNDVDKSGTNEDNHQYMFNPPWALSFRDTMIMPLGARIGNGHFFEGGKSIKQQAQLCRRMNCPKCGQGNEKVLQMVHRQSLRPISADDRAGRNTSFACTGDDLRSTGHPEWYQGGPVIKVYITTDEGDMDVMVCQYQACVECTDRNAVPEPRPHTTCRLPFVHRSECTDLGAERGLTFSPSRHDQLDKGTNCEIERLIVQYDIGDEPGENGVMSAVCIADTCSVCNPSEEDIANRVAEELIPQAAEAVQTQPTTSGPQQQDASTGATANPTSAEAQNGGQSATETAGQSQSQPEAANPGNVGEPEPEPEPTDGGLPPAPTGGQDTSQANPPIPQTNTIVPPTGPVIPPVPPAGPVIPPVGPVPAGAFRMCHMKHLAISAAGVTWRKGDKEGGPVVNTYFVANNWPSLAWGGPVYRVDFPNGTTQDVMACRRHRCKSCRKRPATLTGVATNARPFVHRQDLTLDPATQTRTFTPVASGAYDCPADNLPLTIVSVTFSRAGAGGGSAIATPCETCTAGSCPKCG